MWTQFWDMSSGGSQKEAWHFIYIEADTDTAQIVFYNRFKHNPNRVTCTCCGEDYSISSDESLEQLTGYHRNCAYDNTGYIDKPRYGNKFQTLDEYKQNKDVLFIYAHEITEQDKHGDIPLQGYVWVE